MNKKDLFNAIDNIDEKFISDAGKYLKNVDPFQDEEPEELEPQKRPFSPIRLIAPIAASLTVIAGIAIGLKMVNFGIDKAPIDNNVNAAPDTSSSSGTDTILDSAVTPSASGKPTDNKETSDGLSVTETTPSATEELPFKLYGPDMVPLTYGDVSSVEGAKGYENVGLDRLTAENWSTIACMDFAYIADPLGENYNSYFLDDTDMRVGEEKLSENIKEGSAVRRIYKGDKFNDLVVTNATCCFCNTWKNGTADKTSDDLAIPQMFNQSYVSFDGELVTNGYIVKIGEVVKDGIIPVYRFFFDKGEIGLPLMNYAANQNGGFDRQAETESFDSFSYIGELPCVNISIGHENTELDAYFVDTNVRPAAVQLSNISMLYSADSAEGFQMWADTSIVEINGAPYGGSEYNGTFQSVIDKASTTSELSYILWEETELMQAEKDLAYFRVFRVDGNGSRQWLDEVTDEDTTLVKGMVVYFYDKEGNVYSHYEYTGEQAESAVQSMPDRPVE